MKRTISASEAARSFSDLLNRVRYRGDAFVVERAGKPVCEITPPSPVSFTGADLLRLLASLPKPDAEYLDSTESLLRNQPNATDSPWPRS